MPGNASPDKALANLQQWLAHPGNRATLLERPERALAEYAALPVRRFSNAHTEKAAGYVRSPSTVCMDSTGYWLQAEAIHDWAAQGTDPGPAWSRAAAWRLWGMAVQCARLEGGEITDPHILSDKAAEVLYLLAAVGDRLRCEQWGRRMLALRSAGHLRDAGSKSGPFALSLLTHWLTPAAAQPVGVFCMPYMVDTSGACVAYQKLVNHLHADSHSPPWPLPCRLRPRRTSKRPAPRPMRRPSISMPSTTWWWPWNCWAGCAYAAGWAMRRRPAGLLRRCMRPAPCRQAGGAWSGSSTPATRCWRE